MIVETEVSEQHGAGKEEGGRVGLIFALDIETDVSASRLKDSNLAAHVAAWDDTRSTNQSGGNVGKNTTVKVGHDHNVELLRAGHSLHGSIVNDHVIDLEGRIVLSHSLDSVSEQTIGELHDVGLVNAGHLLTVVCEGEREGELGNTFRLGPGDNLQGFHDARHRLMFQARVLALGVLTHNTKVDILVPCDETGDVLDQHNRGIDVELLSKGNVEGLVTGPFDWGVQNTL